MTAPESPTTRPPAEGELIAVEHEGTALAVARLDGELRAFDATCPHAGCSLAEGELDGRTVVCPCHQAAFDVVTGEVVDGPAPSGVATWEVAVTDGALVLGSRRAAGAEPTAADDDAGPDLDITVLVEREHDAIREQFAALDALTDDGELQQAWTTLSELLEVHASGEEALLYPKLARSADQEGAEEAEHAVRDHNSIRDSVRAVDRHTPGSEQWRQALATARQVNEDHLREEEDDALPLFRSATDRARREQLGREWVEFLERHQHARGLSGEDADPEAVLP